MFYIVDPDYSPSAVVCGRPSDKPTGLRILPFESLSEARRAFKVFRADHENIVPARVLDRLVIETETRDPSGKALATYPATSPVSA